MYSRSHVPELLDSSILVLCIYDQTHGANPEVPITALEGSMEVGAAETSVLSLRLGPQSNPQSNHHVPSSPRANVSLTTEHMRSCYHRNTSYTII